MSGQTDESIENEALIDRMELVMPKFQHVVKYILIEIQGEDRLTLQQLRSLRAIAATENGIPTSKLAKHLNISSPTVTRIIDGLVDRHLVDRQADTEDRRRSRLVLAKSGEDLLAQYERAFHTHLTRRLEELTPHQRSNLWNALEDLETILRDPDAPIPEIG
ncbi:MAG: MarR family winged helix-turn-helix transcriptional regulator [Thermomicrobiales bacterium]